MSVERGVRAPHTAALVIGILALTLASTPAQAEITYLHADFDHEPLAPDERRSAELVVRAECVDVLLRVANSATGELHLNVDHYDLHESHITIGLQESYSLDWTDCLNTLGGDITWTLPFTIAGSNQAEGGLLAEFILTASLAAAGEIEESERVSIDLQVLPMLDAALVVSFPKDGYSVSSGRSTLSVDVTNHGNGATTGTFQIESVTGGALYMTAQFTLDRVGSPDATQSIPLTFDSPASGWKVETAKLTLYGQSPHGYDTTLHEWNMEVQFVNESKFNQVIPGPGLIQCGVLAMLVAALARQRAE